MADNITVPGTGEILAFDEVGGAKIARSKTGWGVDGAYIDASITNPLPVQLTKPTLTHIVCATSTNAVRLKSGQAYLRSVTGYCGADYAVKICFHNSTANPPTAGTGVSYSEVCQAGERIDLEYPGEGIDFTTGLGVTIVKVSTTADLADSASTATVANDGVFNIGWV